MQPPVYGLGKIILLLVNHDRLYIMLLYNGPLFSLQHTLCIPLLLRRSLDPRHRTCSVGFQILQDRLGRVILPSPALVGHTVH